MKPSIIQELKRHIDQDPWLKPLLVTFGILLVLTLFLVSLPGRVWLDRLYRVYVLDELDHPPPDDSKPPPEDQPSPPAHDANPEPDTQVEEPPVSVALPFPNVHRTTIEKEIPAEIKTVFAAWQNSARGSPPDIRRIYGKISGILLGRKHRLPADRHATFTLVDGHTLRGVVLSQEDYQIVIDTDRYGEVKLLPQHVDLAEDADVFPWYSSHIEAVAAYDAWLAGNLMDQRTLTMPLKQPAAFEITLPDLEPDQSLTPTSLRPILEDAIRPIRKIQEKEDELLIARVSAKISGKHRILQAYMGVDFVEATPAERLALTAKLWEAWAFTCLSQGEIEALNDAHVLLYVRDQPVAGSMEDVGAVLWTTSPLELRELFADHDPEDYNFDFNPEEMPPEDERPPGDDVVPDDGDVPPDDGAPPEDEDVPEKPAQDEFEQRIAGLASMLRDHGYLPAARPVAFRVLQEALSEGRLAAGARVLENHLKEMLSEVQVMDLTVPDVAVLSDLLATRRLLDEAQRTFAETKVSRGFRQWLAQDQQRLQTLVRNMKPQDHWPECARILEILAAKDAAGREQYFNLMLAFALVWDQPRPQLHRETERAPDYEPDLLTRYGFCKDLFETRRSAIPYGRLTVDALTFVVDTPVPLSELRWAQQNISGNAPSWEARYTRIGHDPSRFEDGYRPWPYGSYTLEKIGQHGGTRLDRAYFATITARANGLPAVLLEPEEREYRRPAWFAHMRGSQRWDMHAGRTEEDKRIPAFGIDPQTNRRLPDHQMAIRCERSLRDPGAVDETHLLNLAIASRKYANMQAAAAFAKWSLQTQPRFLDAYRFLEDLYTETDRTDEILQLLQAEAEAFKEVVPEHYLEVALKRADMLRKEDREEEADDFLLYVEAVLKRDRPDLARRVPFNQLLYLINTGEPKETRESFERLLMDQKDAGRDVLSWLDVN